MDRLSQILKHMKTITVVILLLTFFTLVPSGKTSAEKIIRLVTAEREPYIGENLPNKGYVYELVTETFQRMGYEVQISFYPLARATYLAEKGSCDGLLPVHDDESLHENFLFSDPFPGDTIGLLKRKSTQAVYAHDPREHQTEALRELSAYTFGVVRGSVNTPEFDQADFLKKDFGTSDIQNLLKLSKGRVDFVVIDKYTAADIMTNRLPHMIGECEFMNPPLASKPFHIAFSKHSPGFRQRVVDFNQGLQEIINDKTLERILYKHGLLQSETEPLAETIIRIATVDNPDMIIMQRLSQEYEKQHPGIKLAWKILDENILRIRLMSDLAISDGRFDIMTIGAYETPIWAKRGWLVPLKNIPEDYDLNDVLKPVRNSLSYNDTLYALPFYVESAMTYYRKDLFEQAGITMPETPTYKDIKKFAATIHDPENDVYGICLRGKPGWGENMAFLTQLIHTFGGQWFDEQWRPTIDSPEWREAITFYKDLAVNYGHPDTISNGFTENLTLFSDGHCGIWIDATVAAGMLFNPAMSTVADKLGFAQAPIGVTPKGSHWLWSWALAIPSSSKVPDEALQFISWATSKEYIELVAEHEGWVSVPPGTRVSTYQNPKYQAQSPFSDFVLTAIQTADPNDNTLKPAPYTGIQYVGIPEFPAIGTQVGQIMVKILEGEITVDQALKGLQRLVYEQMRISGYME